MVREKLRALHGTGSRGFSAFLLMAVFLSVQGFCFFSSLPLAFGQNLQVGTKAPDFVLKDLSGQTKTYADVKGAKLTALVFWAAWSENSPREFKDIEALYHKYKDKGFAVVAIDVEQQNIDNDALAKIRAKMAELKLDVPVLIDYGLVAFHDYEVIAVPTTVILDPDMKIQYELFGYPIVGSADMLDYINGQFGGTRKGGSAKNVYMPSDKALRCYNLGMRMLESGRMADMAPAWLEKASAADPKFARPNVSLGEYYAAHNQPQLAKQQFEQALTKEPGNVIATCDLGTLLAGSGDVKGGMALMEKALKLDEAYTPCYYMLGYYYGKGGDMAKARKLFDAGARLDPMDSQVYMYEGKLYEGKNDARDAAVAYGKALKIMLKQ
ncbi:MAG: redoxin domain-containing protein [Nitrospiraceae bacterium]|nr:redoxin domain-containing protein [Nitrospiraceae bacterium]